MRRLLRSIRRFLIAWRVAMDKYHAYRALGYSKDDAMEKALWHVR